MKLRSILLPIVLIVLILALLPFVWDDFNKRSKNDDMATEYYNK